MDDLQKMIRRKLSIQRREAFKKSPQLCLGEIIGKLEAISPFYGSLQKDEKTIRYDFEYLIPTTLQSWRGSYDELALGWTYLGYSPNDCPDHNCQEGPKITDFIKHLEEAIGKYFVGWKGGDFVMSEETPVWVANPGNVGETAIVDVVDNGYEVILITERCEF